MTRTAGQAPPLTTERPGARPWPRVLAAAVAGALAAAVSIAVSELIAGLVPGAPSLVLAIGALIIDLQPPGAKDLVVGLFGTNDKLALNVLILVVALLIAAALGIAGRSRIRRAETGFVAFGAVALVAAWREPLVSFPLAVVTAVVAVAAGLAALRFLLDRAPGQLRRPNLGRRDSAEIAMPSWDRRRFLARSVSLAAGAVVAGGIGRSLQQRRSESLPAVSTVLPHPSRTVAPLAPDESLSVPGITPIVVPNDAFYRIDTALLAPHVDVSSWRLTVSGMVDRPLTFTYSDLAAMPLFEQYGTIGCVSNEVGGPLVGNAKWTGVHLKEILARAGVQSGATQIVGRSADGWTAGFPTEYAMAADREPMIALEMNDQPLPNDHGYPARLIVPGLYGYVSATKWLTNIELTTLEAFDGYWVPLGWAKEGPILTQSRIDVPQSGSRVAAGTVTVAGVAWAPDRGVSAVEISIDGGQWMACQLSRPISKATWVQWQLPVSLAAGLHRIEVRATDGTGAVQTADISRPAPDGARGHHTIQLSAG